MYTIYHPSHAHKYIFMSFPMVLSKQMSSFNSALHKGCFARAIPQSAFTDWHVSVLRELSIFNQQGWDHLFTFLTQEHVKLCESAWTTYPCQCYPATGQKRYFLEILIIYKKMYFYLGKNKSQMLLSTMILRFPSPLFEMLFFYLQNYFNIPSGYFFQFRACHCQNI